MHGRLKVKTTAEQEAEKRREREVKSKLYLGGVNKIFSKRDEPLSDPECFSISAQLLMVNPDNLSLWNYRREFLIAAKESEDEAAWSGSLVAELKVIEGCLLKNPKSYGAWYHRDWVLRVIPDPPWESELELCDKYLKLDERNFHCWDHRKLIVSGSKRDLSEELEFTQELIEKNFSNYSAWHYRSKLLPKVHPPHDDSPHPVEGHIFISELKKVVTAIFTDPSDQSPWFFLRWLLSKKPQNRRLIESGIIFDSENEIKVILVFSEYLLDSDLEDVCLRTNEGDVQPSTWVSLANNFIWYTTLKLEAEATELVCGYKDNTSHHDLRSKGKGPPIFKLFSHSSKIFLPESSLKSLEEIKANCILLDELDAGNKWVLLSLVEVMSALNPLEHLGNISSYIHQLKEIDPLRANYYSDLWSKIRMDVALAQHVEGGGDTFSLAHSGLTRLVNIHRLVSTKIIDLTGNLLTKIEFSCLFSCEELILDENKDLDLVNIFKMPRLRYLSLNRCEIDCVDKLSFLSRLNSIEKLSLNGNLFPSIESSKEILATNYPNIKELYL